MENFWRAARAQPAGRPSRVCSGALHLLLLAAASTTAVLLLLPAVTLHRPAPRRDQAPRRPATRPPAPPRVQVQHARLLPVEPAEPLGLKAPSSVSRSPTHAALARSPEPAPAGGCARCWPDHQLRANFPGARAARSASPPRSGARKENGPDGAQGEPDSPRRSTPKCSHGENLFCRQSRETCESGLRSRRSRGVFIVYISLSEGLPPKPTSPSAPSPPGALIFHLRDTSPLNTTPT